MTTSKGATTLIEKVRLAKSYVDSYKANNGYWIALGKNSPWPDEARPPLPSISLSKIPTAFLFVYVHTCLTVYDDDDGIISTRNRKFSYIEADDLKTLATAKANKVYFEAIIPKNTVASSYRIMALCSGLTSTEPLTNLGAGFMLSNDQVIDYYTSWVEMTSPVVISTQSNHVIQIIREF